MVNVCLEPITDRSAWLPDQIGSETNWVFEFDRSALTELDGALRRVQSRGYGAEAFGRGDFPLPNVSRMLADARHVLQDGCGFVLIRGLPVDGYGLDELKALYWGVGVHLGRPMPQNRDAELVVHVTDYGEGGRVLGDRGYRKSGALPPHTDYTDTVGLLCVRGAREGGSSTLVSVPTLHNQILRTRPDLLPHLYLGMHTNLRGEGPTRAASEASPAPFAPFEYHDGRLTCFFSHGRFLAGQEASGIALNPEQVEALDYLAELSRKPEFTLTMDLRPGDMQFINNHVVLHSRTSYVDFDVADRKRLLLRMWIRFDEEIYRMSPQRSHVLRWGMDRVRPALV